MAASPLHSPSSFSRTRRRFLFTALPAVLTSIGALALGLTGCGGGSDERIDDIGFIDTGANGASSNMYLVQTTPSTGAVFIPRATDFRVAWPDPNVPPPPQFSLELRRYKEKRGDAERETPEQASTITRQGNNYVWNVRRRDNSGDLDANAVYFLQMRTPDNNTQVLVAFITGSNRSVAAPTRAETVNTGSNNGSLSGLTISPQPGGTFIPSTTIFQLAWNGATPPPPSFEVGLRRFKEERGGEDLSDEEQRITVTRQEGTNTWLVRRRDNFRLDTGGVYYLEVRASGETARAAYIVSNDI